MQETVLTGWDWAMILALLGFSIGVGLLVKDRAEEGGLEGFFVAGRNMRWWFLGTSIVATTLLLIGKQAKGPQQFSRPNFVHFDCRCITRIHVIRQQVLFLRRKQDALNAWSDKASVSASWFKT